MMLTLCKKKNLLSLRGIELLTSRLVLSLFTMLSYFFFRSFHYTGLLYLPFHYNVMGLPNNTEAHFIIV